MSRQEYQFSNLTQEQLKDITRIEEEVNKNSNEEIILLAYNKL